VSRSLRSGTRPGSEYFDVETLRPAGRGYFVAGWQLLRFVLVTPLQVNPVGH